MVKEIDKKWLKIWLSKERKSVQGLGQGYHKNQLYYGSTIENPNGLTLDCVVNSNRDIYIDYTNNGKSNDARDRNEIRDDYGLKYRFRFFEDVLDFTWSRASIQNWLLEGYKVNIKDIFDRLLKVNANFMVYEDKRIHKFVVLDIMKTFIFQLFPANGRTYFNAEKDSGKTNQLMIYKAFSFNPTTSADFSSASIYRIIESTGATILFDDFDELPDKQKGSVIRHIRVNYKPFKTLRADGGGGRSFSPTAYNSYSHLVFNNVLGLGNDYITLSRIILIRLLKSSEGKELIFNPKNKQWQPLRDDLYCMGLQYFKEIMHNFNTIKVEGLTTRNLEIYKPILSIAKTISDDLYDEMLRWCKDLIERESVRDVSEDWEFLMLQELWDLVKNEEKTKRIPVKRLTNQIALNLGFYDLSKSQSKRQERTLSVTLGKKLRGYLIFNAVTVDGCVNYDVDKEGLERIIEKQGFTDDIINKKEGNKKPEKQNPKITVEDTEKLDWDVDL